MEVVSQIRSALVSQLGDERFELWFGNQVELQFEKGQLVLLAGSQFAVDTLRKSFLEELKLVTRQVCGQEVRIEFRVDTNRQSIQNTSVRPKSVSINPPRLPKENAMRAPGGRRKFAKLDSFVVGVSNRMAMTSVRMVIDQLGKINPLFLHGTTGVGKTHLLEGIWSEIRRSSRRRVVYLSAEQFTSYFVSALKNGGLPSFRHKYRDADILILDDVQFFAGKRATMVELLHTIDAFLRDQRQVILAADRSPSHLHGLGQDLTTRLSCGLVCDIDPLDCETRQTIVERYSQDRQLQLSPEVIEMIAHRAPGDARLISGAVNRLWVIHQTTGKPITATVAQAEMVDMFHDLSQGVRLDEIEQAVCDAFGLEADKLKSNVKARSVSHPRMLAMWLARKHTGAALSEISEYFGRKSHSSVLTAQNRVNDWLSEGSSIQLATGQCDVRDVVRRIEYGLRAS